MGGDHPRARPALSRPRHRRLVSHPPELRDLSLAATTCSSTRTSSPSRSRSPTWSTRSARRAGSSSGATAAWSRSAAIYLIGRPGRPDRPGPAGQRPGEHSQPRGSGGGGLSPRLEAELITMLTRPSQPLRRLGRPTLQIAALFGMLGTCLGVLVVAAVALALPAARQIQDQTERSQALAQLGRAIRRRPAPGPRHPARQDRRREAGRLRSQTIHRRPKSELDEASSRSSVHQRDDRSRAKDRGRAVQSAADLRGPEIPRPLTRRMRRTPSIRSKSPSSGDPRRSARTAPGSRASSRLETPEGKKAQRLEVSAQLTRYAAVRRVGLPHLLARPASRLLAQSSTPSSTTTVAPSQPRRANDRPTGSSEGLAVG